MYGEIDCRRNWTTVGTIMGRCLRLDLNIHNTITTRDSLLMKFAVNSSDITVVAREGHGYNFLTNRVQNGITIYPTHETDDIIIIHHGITLEQKLIPSVTYQIQRHVYAGTIASQHISKI